MRHHGKAYLQFVNRKFETLGIGKIRYAAIVIPYSFTYTQRKNVVSIAESIGISIKSVDTSGVFYSMSRLSSQPVDTLQDSTDIILVVQNHYLELTVIEFGDGIFESKGTIGIRWDERKQIQTEINRYLDDNCFKFDNGKIVNRFGTQQDYHLFIYGEYDQTVIDLLFEITGKLPEEKIGSAAAGALIQCLRLFDIKIGQDILRLATYNKNIWISLGEKGEKAITIERYTTLPTIKKTKLLLSTENRLRVYEGNYFNHSFDTLLAEISLDGLDVKEGEEIECIVEVDTSHMIRISVNNHKKESVIDRLKI